MIDSIQDFIYIFMQWASTPGFIFKASTIFLAHATTESWTISYNGLLGRFNSLNNNIFDVATETSSLYNGTTKKL